jgi:hypothetical protein
MDEHPQPGLRKVLGITWPLVVYLTMFVGQIVDLGWVYVCWFFFLESKFG